MPTKVTWRCELWSWQETAHASDCCKAPTLSPGIFTIYCEHGVCYGFEVLQTCESPKHPFQIFKTRFPHPPLIIIYIMPVASMCPVWTESLTFSRTCTRFAVDRFHWCGHIGCSKGYSLDAYNQKWINGINFQVNEQANSGLQKIRGQLAYMSIENFEIHCSLFLALKEHGQKVWATCFAPVMYVVVWLFSCNNITISNACSNHILTNSHLDDFKTPLSD